MVGKVFIVHPSPAYKTMFEKEGWTVVDYLEESDLVQFTGGADVTPALYGSQSHHNTFTDKARDQKDLKYFSKALSHGKPMAGICRGGQFLHVMNGGTMIQDVQGHTSSHSARVFNSNKTIIVSSTHHQIMVNDSKLSNRPLLVAENYICKKAETVTTINGIKKVVRVTPKTFTLEAVYYSDNNCLCFQPHPEMYVHNEDYKDCKDYYFKFINEVLMK